MVEYQKYAVAIVIGIISYIFGGWKKQRNDAVGSMQKMYEGFIEHFKTQMEGLTSEIKEQKTFNKELQNNFNDLSLKFDNLYIQYSHEVQKNSDWAKMYNELKAKYEVLELQYEKLKKDFEAHKKKTT